MMTSTDVAKGLTLSLIASALFACLTAYAVLLYPLNGQEIFAWRIFWTMPAALLLICIYKRLPAFMNALLAVFSSPSKIATFALLAGLLGLQMWVFLWAPLNGYLLDVSLGYFLLPIALVLVGRFFYKEKLDIFQKLSVLFACIGIAHEIWLTRALSWVVMLIVTGYPLYFMIRRRQQYDQLILFSLEILFLLPVALLWLLRHNSFAPVFTSASLYLLFLPGLGIISATAFFCYLKASKLLPMSLFGILSYAEPIFMLVIVLFFFGETISVAQLGTYIPIWLAVLFTIWHSIRLLRTRSSTQHTNN